MHSLGEVVANILFDFDWCLSTTVVLPHTISSSTTSLSIFSGEFWGKKVFSRRFPPPLPFEERASFPPKKGRTLPCFCCSLVYFHETLCKQSDLVTTWTNLVSFNWKEIQFPNEYALRTQSSFQVCKSPSIFCSHYHIWQPPDCVRGLWNWTGFRAASSCWVKATT